jgi:hypothetical protein
MVEVASHQPNVAAVLGIVDLQDSFDEADLCDFSV